MKSKERGRGRGKLGGRGRGERRCVKSKGRRGEVCEE